MKHHFQIHYHRNLNFIRDKQLANSCTMIHGFEIVYPVENFIKFVFLKAKMKKPSASIYK